MALLPIIFRDMMHMSRPLRMLENHMRMTEELLQPFMTPVLRLQRRPGVEFEEQPENVIHDKDKYEVKVDVQHFAPEEITVKSVGENAIQIEAKHEETQEKGFVARHLIRKFVLPQGYDLKHVVSNLSSDGILTVTSPKTIEAAEEERVIPITHTGPERKIEEKKKAEESA